MIGRIGFRRLLPILFTLLHVALTFYAAAQRHHTWSVLLGSAYHPAAYQENSVTWEPVRPKPLVLAEKLGIVLNLPAFVLAIPIDLLFFHGNDLGLWYSSLPLVPVVWYTVGRTDCWGTPLLRLWHAQVRRGYSRP